MNKRIEWHVEKRIVSELKPYKKNPRIIEEFGLNQLKESFDEIGVAQPVNINTDNTILSGHARCQQLKREDPNQEIMVLVPNRTLTKEEEEAVIIRMNKNTAGEWDYKSLGINFELDDLIRWGFDKDEIEMPEVVELDPGCDEDEVPEVENPITKKGDVWLLGEHRVMCGDSTMIDDVERLMSGEKSDMVFTDPPYNIASDSKNYARDKSKSMGDLSAAEWDKDFNVEEFLNTFINFISENVTVYIWTSHFLIQRIWDGLDGWADYTNYLVWSKPNPMPSLSKRHPTWNTELCVYASKGSKRVVNFPPSGHFLSCRDVVKKSDGSHPTQKPQELITPLIEFSSNKGQLVTDFFLGSGSTLIACEKTNRKCYGMELDEHYCDVIINRWQDYTGKEAVLESNKETYNSLKEKTNGNG